MLIATVVSWVLWNVLHAPRTAGTDLTTSPEPTTGNMLVRPLPPNNTDTTTTTADTGHTLHSIRTREQTSEPLSQIETYVTSLSQATLHNTGHGDDAHVTRNVPVTTYNLAPCVQNPDSKQMHVEHTKGRLYYESSNNTIHTNCEVVVRVPRDKIVLLQINECKNVDMRIRERSNVQGSKMFFLSCLPQTKLVIRAVYSLTDAVVITVVFPSPVFRPDDEKMLSMDFFAVNHTDRPNLELVFLSPSEGYLQTPGWKGSTQYPPFVRSCVTLTPPPAHVIFLSFVSLSLGSGDEVLVFPGRCASERSGECRYISNTRLRAFVFPDDFQIRGADDLPLSVHIFADDSSQQSGFRLRFSFHSCRLKPVKVTDLQARNRIRWNCSASVWPGLSEHFPCDMDPQCLESEDEAPCPYTSEKCGLNRVESGGRCYIYKTQSPRRSWVGSEKECRASGASLASLETSEEWNKVLELLKHAGDPRLIWIGLKAARHTTGKYINTIGSNATRRVPLVTCPRQHVTRELMACDPASVCRRMSSSREDWYHVTCSTPLGLTRPYFYCGDSAGDFVPYSLVCDFREDCAGGGDELFCVHPACEGRSLNCGQGQCVGIKKRCDGYEDCTTGLDEVDCADTSGLHYGIRAPAVVNFDMQGQFHLSPLPANNTQCPDTHFQCHNDGYCLPVYVRCNGVNDCPDHEDELWCNGYRCPGFYRCRGSDRTICVHVHHLCDGLPHCPQRDDELMCDLTCPEPCTCSGLAFTCTHTFQVSSFPQLRFLEAKGSRLGQTDILFNAMLIHLGVQACGWSNVTGFASPNLHSLDLSDNLLRHINFDPFAAVYPLRRLNLAGNPISSCVSGHQREYLLPSLLVYNCSRTLLDSLKMDSLSTMLPNLQILDLSQIGIKTIETTTGEHFFPNLHALDMRGCPVNDFTPDFMKSMSNLKLIYADNFKLCCSAVLPDGFRGECLAPSDTISSCEDLLKSTTYRLALAAFALLAIFGNFGSIVYRLWFSSERIKSGFAVFVLHLCVSDLFMGVYLALIGVADQVFAGIYIWSEATWKKSGVCSVAGFVSFLSSEVSAFLICIITLDRFLVLRFPFSQIRFRATSAHVACVVIWVVGLILATVPLLPVTSHWEFYHQTGICIPLPVTRADFAGHGYSFSVMIVCNLVLFILIAVGQSLIYWSVRSNAMSEKGMPITSKSSDSVKSKDAIIARRLLTVAMSDFLCWFPIGLCGLLAAIGVVIPGEVNVAMAIFVLPLNSALNPFLYTLNIILEKRQKAQELRFHKFVQAHLKNPSGQSRP